VGRALAPWLRQVAALDPGLRPVRADGLHVTLRFLGRVEPVREGAVHAVAARVAAANQPFSLSLENMGTFPRRSRPRVLWVGVEEGSQEIGCLAASLQAGLAAEGWSPDPGPYRAHCTLARIPEGLSPRSAKALTDLCARDLGPLRVATNFVALLESLPVPGGPNRYPRRARWRLGRT
jgi:2'-5' RNA ligase